MAATSDTIETIHAMLRQESEYAVTTLPYPTDIASSSVDAKARGTMAQWCCQVVTYCRLEIEVVFIAMNYADRMCMADPSLLANRASYQKVVMTALYTAAKIHALEALGPTLVSRLSNRAHSAEEIEHQESTLLSTLQWRLNPPTPHSFVQQYMVLYEPMLTKQEQRAVLHFALQQVDEYLIQFQCCTTVRESVMAYCAVQNALEQLPVTASAEKPMAILGYNLTRLAGIDPMSDQAMISGVKFVLLSLFPALHVVPSPYGGHKRLHICEPESESVVVRRDYR